MADVAKSELIQVRMSPEDKAAAKELCARYGLTVSAAVSLYLKTAINQGVLPLVSMDTPTQGGSPVSNA